MFLPADAAAALWTVYDHAGIRPEWLLPTLWIESEFTPGVQNRAGAPYYGIAQNSVADLTAAGAATPVDYLTWTATEQIESVVNRYFVRVVAAVGPLRSAVRVYQGTFLPATVLTARTLASVVCWRGSPAYDANPGLDPLRAGAITVSDLALVVAKAAARVEVRRALALAYAARPGETPAPVVYGRDYTDPLWWLLAPASAAAYASGVWTPRA